MISKLRLRTVIAVAGVFLAAAILPAPFAVAGPTAFQADQLIGKGLGPLVGDGIHNTSGAGQTKVARLHRGGRAEFAIVNQNDGLNSDSFLIFGCSAAAGFKVKYLTLGVGPGLVDITSTVESGLYQTDVLPSGGSATEFLRIKVKHSADSGDSLACLVVATSVGASLYSDAVKAKVKVR